MNPLISLLLILTAASTNRSPLDIGINYTKPISPDIYKNCGARIGKLNLDRIELCKSDSVPLYYNPNNEIIPTGARRWFVMHNSPIDTIGNIVVYFDTLPMVFYKSPMLNGNTYFLSPVIAFPDRSGNPNFLDSCLVVGKGKPVYFVPTPEKPQSLEIANSSKICPGETVTLNTNRIDTGFTYCWFTPQGLKKTNSPILTLTNFSMQDNGLYYVATQFMNCFSPKYGPATFKIDPSINEAFAEPDKVVCGRDSSLILANLPIGATGKWTSVGKALITNPNEEQTLVKNLLHGRNLFVWSVTVGRCFVSDTLQVYHQPRPNAHNDTFLLSKNKNILVFNVLGNDTLKGLSNSYLKLSIDNKSIQSLIKIDTLNNIIIKRDNSIEKNHQFNFFYSICNTDTAGRCPALCDDAEVIIEVDYEKVKFINPTIGVTPNSANPNWTFEALQPIYEASLKIVNRWGYVVFEDNYTRLQKGEIVNAWNGQNTNIGPDSGAYFYVIEGLIENNEKVIQRGVIYMIK